MSKSWAANAAMGGCLVLGLSACGGGGGSNVKPTPPGGGTPVEPPNIATTNLVVNSGESVTKPVILIGQQALLRVDNAGSIGGSTIDLAISSDSYYGKANIVNHDGGTIEGRQAAILLGALVLNNDGAGTAIRSAGIAVRAQGGAASVTNANGASITGGTIGISSEHGGIVRNSAGSTVATTGTAMGDCGTGGSCAIYASPNTELGQTQQFRLENAGTIIGNVQMDPNAFNSAVLTAGGTIRGNLDMGLNPASDLTLAGEAGASQLFSQAITGSTRLFGVATKNGQATWWLDSAALANANSIVVNAGDFIVQAPAFLGNGRLAVPDGRFILDFDQDATLSNIFQGNGYSNGEPPTPGFFLKEGAGELTIRDNNIGDGLRILLAGGALRIASGGSGVPGGALILENNTRLVLDGDLKTYLRISGTGSVVKTGSGNARVGTGSTYTGGTRIDGGGLTGGEVLPGDVVVGPAGTLGFIALNPAGTHAVEGNVTSSGTVIAADGVTTIGGNYSQSSTGTLAVELGGKIEVAGTATLEGGTLQVTGADLGFIANSHTEVLTAAGGLTGIFDRFIETSNDIVLASSTIYYDGHSVWLDTTGLDVSWNLAGDGVGYTPASMSAAVRVQGAFEQLNDRISTRSLAGVPGDFMNAAGQFQRAPSIAAAQASLRSLSGQLHAASAAMTFRAIDAGNQALSDRLGRVRAGSGAVGMWTQQLGGNGSMARSGFDGIGFQIDGWLVGNDFRIGRNGVAGFAFGEGMGRQQLQHGADRDDSHRTEGMVYAGLAGDRWYAQGRVGFGHVRQLVDRQLLLGTASTGVWTRYDGRYQAAYGESGLRFGFGGLRIAPFASVEYASSDRDGFVEEGAGGFGLRSDARTIDRWQASLGLRATRRWDFGHGRTLDFGAHAQWRRALGAIDGEMDASFVGLQQWSPLSGIGLSRRGSVLGFGMDAQLSPRAALKLSYDYERGQYDSAQGVTAGLNVAF